MATEVAIVFVYDSVRGRVLFGASFETDKRV